MFRKRSIFNKPGTYCSLGRAMWKARKSFPPFFCGGPVIPCLHVSSSVCHVISSSAPFLAIFALSVARNAGKICRTKQRYCAILCNIFLIIHSARQAETQHPAPVCFSFIARIGNTVHPRIPELVPCISRRFDSISVSIRSRFPFSAFRSERGGMHSQNLRPDYYVYYAELHLEIFAT